MTSWAPSRYPTYTYCLASPANFIYGWVEAKVLSHVTFMAVLLRPVYNFLGQVIGNASKGKYNTVNNSSSGEFTFQKCLNSGITLFSSKNSNKFQTFATGAYQRLHEAQPRHVVWLWEPEYLYIVSSPPPPPHTEQHVRSIRGQPATIISRPARMHPSLNSHVLFYSDGSHIYHSLPCILQISIK